MESELNPGPEKKNYWKNKNWFNLNIFWTLVIIVNQYEFLC